MDDTQLRELLEEAITYKNPCDIGNKSDYFKVDFKFIVINPMDNHKCWF